MKKVLSVLLAAVMLFSIFSVLPAAERAEAVTAVEYEKQNPVICYYETTGSFDTNGQGEQYFRYDGFGYAEGDALIVYYQGLSAPVRYFARFNSELREMEFVAEDGDTVSSHDLHIESNQAEHPFTLGSDNYYYVCYKTFKAPVQVTVVENPVKKVEYIPLKSIEIFENSEGQWETDDEGEEYFDYYNPSYQAGDILRLTLNGGVVVDYTYQYNEQEADWFFFDDEGNILEDRNELFTTKGANGRWSLGNNNSFYVIYKDVRSAPINVSIVVNPVKAIRFTPANQAVYIQGTNMYYDNWYETYYYDEPQYEEGDVLTVIDNNSSEKDYTYDNDEDCFISADGARINTSDTRRHSNQNLYPWSIGSNNAYIVEYMGRQATVYVTIIENPVKAISFVPAKQAQYIEGTHMWYDDWDEAYYYDEPGFQVGDILKVTDKNNVTTSYVYGYGDNFRGEFTASNGKVINSSEVKVRSNQSANPWKVGDNEYTIEYSGRTCTANVKIVANPVDSIEYTPKEPYVLVEGQDMWYDDWDEQYYYRVPRMEEGDVLTVHYNDGRGAVDYTLQYNPQTDTRAFVSASGDVIADDWEIIHTYHDQSINPWRLGSDNHFFVEYSGKQASVQVTIVQNHVDSIKFTPKEEITVYATECRTFTDDSGNEHKEYAAPNFNEGDILTITDKEGNSKDYVYSFNEADGEYYFVSGEESITPYDIEIDPYLLGDDWEVGADNYFTMRYMGAETQVKVNLINTDVRSITFTKATPIVLTENKDGAWRYNERGMRFFCYDAQLGNVGDVLTVNYLNGATLSYTVKFDSEQEGAYLEAPNGDRLVTRDVGVYDDQSNEPWTPGGENVFYVSFHGVTTEVPVTVNHDYDVRVVAPKANAVGYTLHECKACSESYKTDFKAPIGKPSGFKCVSRTAAAEKFSWNKMGGVTGYQVQLLNAKGGNAGLKVLTGNSFTFTKLAAGHAYKARVRFYIKAEDGKNYYGAWTTINSPTLPAGTTIAKLAGAKKAFAAQWKKGACTGYQLQYSTNKKFTGAKTVTIKKPATIKYAVKNLASKRVYYVRIRTYKTINRVNYYSVWSATKPVKTK